jgi:GntR family transcriptional repressor for pyruvate dehydrogenase complex
LQDRTLKSGRLPPERELARSLGVSRTSLREAIRILTIHGILEPRPGRGTLINESSRGSIAPVLAALRSPEHRHVHHIMEVRKALEPDIAAAAAARATPAEIRNLEAILARGTQKVAQEEPSVDEDAEFHHALAVATRNPVFVQVVARCMDLIQVTRQRVLQSRERNRVSWRGHQRIMEAVREGDPAAAYGAMVKHLLEVGRLMEVLPRRERRR